jgi:SAM-dependent methyltransferase
VKPFEFLYLCLQPVYLPLHRQVRRELVRIARGLPESREILDVGGRKSHYTIGVPANITISDLPRRSELQHRLALGINEAIAERTKKRRSNVREVVFDDMTRSSLPSETFECVVAVEVLEHVEDDASFVANVYRVLRPGGVFLMTTPNGDYVRNTNPDHKRHYTRQQLAQLLCEYFPESKVHHAIKGGVFHRWGLRGWSLKRPKATMLSLLGNFINSLESGRAEIRDMAVGTHHLIAFGRKPSAPPELGLIAGVPSSRGFVR